MPVTDSFVRVAPDSTGKKIDNVQVATSQGDVQRQVTIVGDPETPSARQKVVNGAPARNDYGAVVRPLDAFSGGEVLADQTGAGGVLTFTFSAEVDLAWVVSDGDLSRCDPFGGTPSSSLGIPAFDEVPTPMPVRTSSVKVFAPSGAIVSVYGYRY